MGGIGVVSAVGVVTGSVAGSGVSVGFSSCACTTLLWVMKAGVENRPITMPSMMNTVNNLVNNRCECFIFLIPYKLSVSQDVFSFGNRGLSYFV
jgi:hypothetical protein